ncbi:hypothetical protein [Allosphingosinicella indica]|uniref:ATPase n=1 Tax=Allosphingosinicella indica TaxID=941907 RepID=A0A1X7GWE1_9SPHN|nr:hypothetical protein [Allosphingosinicella indica]SMF75789.1 hypothetical protein SAMN06295910_2379 [Allosphingosinicella indica]
MSMGYPRAEAQQPQGDGVFAGVSTVPESAPEEQTLAEWLGSEAEPDEERPSRRPAIVGAIIVLLALAWIAVSAWSVWRAAPPSIESALGWANLVSPPLILLGIAWIILGRSPRRETERFRQAVAEMRSESTALENVLAIVAQRLADNKAQLTGEAERLMTLGDEAADRLGRVTHYLARETKTLDRQAEALESAASNARVDIGVLLHDLPRAEEQARAVGTALREVGIEAHSQAGSLEGQLSALAARGREADEAAGGAAQRLGAHLARIESNAAAASERMEQAAAAMTAAIDGSMTQASDAVDTTRSALDAQGAAMLASIEQNRAALEHAGEEATRNLAQRLETISGRIQGLAGHLATQDAASHALMDRLSREMASLEERFDTLRESGSTGATILTDSFQTVRACAQELFTELGTGHERAGDLIDRAHEMAQALTAVAEQLDVKISSSLEKVEARAEQTNAAATAILPQVQAVEGSADAAAMRMGEAEASLKTQQDVLEALLTRLGTGLDTAQTQILALGEAAAEADRAAAKLSSETGPSLVEALVRVRETAGQAAERARTAIGAVIPESAAKLADASRDAIAAAISGPIQQQMDDVAKSAESAADAARAASERLTRQLLAISETAAALERRMDEEHKTREEQESAALSRRVALLIESLNSTAIDVTKVLSNDVTDSAWAAYLKGDRGIFTRRAVRLLDSGEAREVLQLYETEPEFREQVNRYIHDFESMIRRVLADRDGSALGVTILSSDMGKLYVALAQAIERLRA